MILSTGEVPDDWNTSFIVPVFKSGDKSDPNNYRGISICSNLSKLFTSIINERITKHLATNDLLAQEQAGFRKEYRTTDNMFILNHIINKY